MSNQYFGQYLLNKGLLTKNQLCEVLNHQQAVKVKLGTLAIDAGLMSAAQVEEIHNLQRTKDQKFGLLAVSKDYLTYDQVETLLNAQSDDLSVLQLIADKGYLSLAAAEIALTDYRNHYSLPKETAAEETMLIRDAVDFSAAGSKADLLYVYAGLTLRNIVRFLDDTPYILSAVKLSSPVYSVTQDVFGDVNMSTALHMEETTLLGVSGKFYGEALTTVDKLALDIAGEFLNVHNGVFCSSLSDAGLIVDLKAPSLLETDSSTSQSCRMSIGTSYGVINLVLSV